MHPRRFARVRPTGRNSDVVKLIFDPKVPVIDCKVIDYSPGGACLEIWGKPSCLIDLNCYTAARRSAVGLFGAPGGVWGSHFNRLVCRDASRSQARR